MSRRADPAALLERAILVHAARAAITINLAVVRSTRWASATFTGARHHGAQKIG